MLKKLKDFYNTYQYFYFKFWALHILVLVSLFTIDFKYFLYSMLIYSIYQPLLHLVQHEYISHEYVWPKNQWADLFCLLVNYINDTNVAGKKAYHGYHHKTWKTPDQDPTQRKMKGVPVWRYILGFYRPPALNLPPVKCNILLRSRWAKHLDLHYRKIHWIFVSVCFIVLPWPWFVVVCIYMPWYGAILFYLHDHLYHGKIKAKDRSYLLPFYGSSAWHVTHHANPRTWYHGPGIWKYLNLGWYYQLLLCKFSPSKIKN